MKTATLTHEPDEDPIREAIERLPMRLGYLLTMRGLTQADLARKADVPPSQLTKLLKAQVSEPSLSLLMKIARALDLSLDDLLYGQLLESKPVTPAASSATSILSQMRSQHPHELANRNAVVFGAAGAGKSYFAKAEILQELLLGIPVRVVDPQNEYENLTEVIRGETVLAGFNVLQPTFGPFVIHEGITAESNHRTALYHVYERLMHTLEVAGYKENSGAADAILRKMQLLECISYLWQKHGFSKEAQIWADPKKWAEQAWPTLHDLLPMLRSLVYSRPSESKLLPVLPALQLLLDDEKIAEALTRPMQKPHQSVFVRYAADAVSEAYWPLLMRLGMEQAVEMDNLPVSGWLVVDEAHRIGSAAQKSGASFLEHWARTARKFRIGLVTLAQSFDIFALDENAGPNARGRAVIQNASVRIFFRQDAGSRQVLMDIMRMTQEEAKKLARARTGFAYVYWADKKHEIDFYHLYSASIHERLTESSDDRIRMRASSFLEKIREQTAEFCEMTSREKPPLPLAALYLLLARPGMSEKIHRAGYALDHKKMLEIIKLQVMSSNAMREKLNEKFWENAPEILSEMGQPEQAQENAFLKYMAKDEELAEIMRVCGVEDPSRLES